MRDRFALLDRDYQRLIQPRSSPATSQVSATSATQAAATSAPPASGASQTVELSPIIVRKDQAGVASSVKGRVVEVNQAHQFVVVDKGSEDGILLGMTLDIIRGAARVGRVRVVRVRPQISACDVIRSDTVDPLQVGDAVTQHSW